MKSISWNDMNDDSDMENLSSDEQNNKIPQDKNKNVQVPPLQKTVSSPEQSLKSQKYDNNPKIAQNLQKLSRHMDSKVWLYLADNTNKQMEINKILEDHKQFQKIHQLNKGWNVLIRTQIAEKYIEKGYFQKGILLKFIYSNKNENRSQIKQIKKVQKKFSEKYSNKNYDYDQVKSPKIKSKITYNDKSIYQKEKQYNETGDRKKVKYVAKQSGIKKIQQQIQPPLSPERKSNQDQLNNLATVENIQTNSNSFEQGGKAEQNKTKQKIRPSQQQNKRSTQKRKQSQNLRQQSEQQQQSPKQKKKKLKKKKTSKSSYHDPNNPFSAFG